MNTLTDKISEIKSRAAANATTQAKSNKSTPLVADHRQSTAQMKTLQQQINNSPRVQPLAQLQKKLDERNFTHQPAIQKKENKTGLPNNLKAGIENLSGYSMDDVKVHYNSDKPAQLQAHAYAQGTNIHLGPGQEKHLPHEAWHVVQQKQGRVKPTIQMKGGVNVNDDKGLEKEADVMGARAATARKGDIHQSPVSVPNCFSEGSVIVQCNFISQNNLYRIEDNEKEKLFKGSEDAPAPQPTNLYTDHKDRDEPYWTARVKFIHKTDYQKYTSQSRAMREDDFWLEDLMSEVKQVIKNLPKDGLFILSRNDCQLFAQFLKLLIEKFQSDEQSKNSIDYDSFDEPRTSRIQKSINDQNSVHEKYRWSNVDIGTSINHQFDMSRKLNGDVRNVSGHQITIVAVDGTSKIALQANAGGNLTKPQFIGLNSYKDWLDLVETPEEFRKEKAITTRTDLRGPKNLYNIRGGFKKKIQEVSQMSENGERIIITHRGKNEKPSKEEERKQKEKKSNIKEESPFQQQINKSDKILNLNDLSFLNEVFENKQLIIKWKEKEDEPSKD